MGSLTNESGFVLKKQRSIYPARGIRFVQLQFTKPSFKRGLVILGLAVILGIAVVFLAPGKGSIYWGAYIEGGTYGLNDAPWNVATIERFEAHAQKKISILHWGQPWWDCRPGCGYRSFKSQQPQYELVRQRGYIPLVDWASWNLQAPSRTKQPKYSLQAIIRGDHDAYIREWATQAAAWGHPFFLRFNWEMNGSWYPWSEKVNGNTPGEYVAAWRHVHDIFKAVGATNVTWVWCVNTLHDEAIPIEGLYPGDAYVDWTCMDGYNRGKHPLKNDRWRTFRGLFTPTYNALLSVAPNKPIMIGEFASTEIGGSKAEWIREALVEDIPTHFPRIKAVVWFNWNHDGMDWVIESSPSAQSAFAESIRSDYYTENNFARLNISPIPPPEHLPLSYWYKKMAIPALMQE